MYTIGKINSNKKLNELSGNNKYLIADNCENIQGRRESEQPWSGEIMLRVCHYYTSQADKSCP